LRTKTRMLQRCLRPLHGVLPPRFVGQFRSFGAAARDEADIRPFPALSNTTR
jgi:hypothetical protein